MTILTGFIIGLFFGAFLYLAGLADPDKIVGALRLKDFHALRVIAVFVLVGMFGTWLLSLFGLANFNVKLAAIWSNLLGGALLGIGFGLIGYCPGTGLACAAAGRLDALVAVIGMFFGALAFIFIYPSVAAPLEGLANYGNVTIPEVTGIPTTILVLIIVTIGVVALFLTSGRKRETPESASKAFSEEKQQEG
jgi:hypothetical protein